MNRVVLALVIIPLLGVYMYWQADYVLILERVEMISYDRRYIRFAQSKTFRINRTNTAINFTFHAAQGFGLDLKVQIQAYRFASNEYRLFPIRLIFDVCDSITNHNDWGLQNLYDCGNFSRCPLKKGNFVICNWAPDYSRFPPYIPGGRYKAELVLIYKSKEIGFLEAYTEVKPKNPWE